MTTEMNDIKSIIKVGLNFNSNSSIKTEPNEDYIAGINPEKNPTETIKITPIKLEVIDTPVISSTEKIIIKEELNIDDESNTNPQNWDEITDQNLESKQKIQCEICPENFTQSKDLNKHLFIMHRHQTIPKNENYCLNDMKNNRNGKKIFKCKICDKDFTAINSLKTHLLGSHRPLIAHENMDFSETIINKIICRICNGILPTKKSLINHLTLMHRPYTINGHGAYCTRCLSWFPEENFKDHRPCINPVQNINPIFTCDICYAEFKLENLLQTHMYVIHRPLTLQFCSDAFCDKCNRWFKEENFSMHKCFRQSIFNKNITSNLCDVFRCAVCSEEFESDVDIKKHLCDLQRSVVGVDCDYLASGSSTIGGRLKLRQQITSKTEYEYDNEDPDEKRKRLNREKQRRWREKQRKEKLKTEEKNIFFKKEKNLNEDELLQKTDNLLHEDPIEKKKRLNREKQQRWRKRKSEALDRIWEEKMEKQLKNRKQIRKIVEQKQNNETQCMFAYISGNQQNVEDPISRKKRLSRERQSRWRNKKIEEASKHLQKAVGETKVQGCRRAREKTNKEIQVQRTNRETPERMNILTTTLERIQKSPGEAADILLHARRTGPQLDEEIQHTIRRNAKDTSEQTKTKRRAVQNIKLVHNQLSSQSDNSLDEFFDMIMDRWS